MRNRLNRRTLWLLTSTSLMAYGMAAAPVGLDYQLDKPLLKVAYAESGSSCFVAGTRVLMADGSEQPIERIAVGDWVMGRGGRINRVTWIERPCLGGRRLYGFNGERAFVTAEHPFMTRAGWRAIDPEATAAESPSLLVGGLSVGDLLAVVRCGPAAESLGATALAGAPQVSLSYLRLDRLESVAADSEMRVYNLLLDGDHSYFADGFLVHNKGSGSSCFVAGTQVLMSDGSEQPIERIVVGDWVMGRGGRMNRVTGIERPCLGGRRLYAFNGGRAFVTAEHPFMTRAGWRAIDPEATVAETPTLSVGGLAVGDLLAVVRCGPAAETRGATALASEAEIALGYLRLERLESVAADPATRVYNLLLDGDHAYFADGFLVHNKGDGGGDGGGGDGGHDGGDSSGPGSDGGGHDGSDNSGPGSGGEGGEGGEGTTGGESVGHGGAGGFDDVEQVGPDLSREQEAEAIGSGWQ